MRRRAFLVYFLLAFVLLWVPDAQAQANGPSVAVLNTAPLKVSGEKGKDTVEAKLSVLNEGSDEVPIDVKFQASSNERVVVKSWSPETLHPGAARLIVTLEGVQDLSEPATGQLVIAGGEAPVAQSIEVDPPAPDNNLPLILILGSLALAVLVALFVVGSLDDTARLGNAAPNPKWEFSSWATTLTAIGAGAAVLLGKVTFPPFPENISNAELVNLGVFFGVLALVGPFLFETIRSYDPRRDAAKVERTGTNRTMLIASSFTLWAAIGQIGTGTLLAWELLNGNAFAYLAAAVAAIFVLLACWYFFSTTSEQVRRDWKQEEEEARKKTERGEKAPEPSRSWSLL